MNLIAFAILTFCIHQTVGQDNVRSSDFAKSGRRLQDVRAIDFNSNTGLSQQRLSIEDTPDEFAFKKPANKDQFYDEFLSILYRRDKAKSKVKREIKSDSTLNEDVSRGKRMLVFRPLFVYKQQEIKRQKVKDQKKGTKKPYKPTKKQG